MDSEELLAQLADIHLPEPVGLWPPAPGWWILALLLLVSAVLGTRRFIRYDRLRKVCRHALAELDLCLARLNSAAASDSDVAKLRYINEVNTVLRRVALVHFPLAASASLDGNAWVDFIRQKGESSAMTEEIAAALSYGRFQKQCKVDVDALNDFGRRWITSLYLQPRPSQSQTSGSGQGMSH